MISRLLTLVTIASAKQLTLVVTYCTSYDGSCSSGCVTGPNQCDDPLSPVCGLYETCEGNLADATQTSSNLQAFGSCFIDDTGGPNDGHDTRYDCSDTTGYSSHAANTDISSTSGGAGIHVGYNKQYFDGHADCQEDWSVPVCADIWNDCKGYAQIGYCAAGPVGGNGFYTTPWDFWTTCRKTCARCLTACHDHRLYCTDDARLTNDDYPNTGDVASTDCSAYYGFDGTLSSQIIWYEAAPTSPLTNIRVDCPLACHTCPCACGDQDDELIDANNVDGTCQHCADTDYFDATYGDCEDIFNKGQCWAGNAAARDVWRTACPYACGHCPGLNQYSNCAKMRSDHYQQYYEDPCDSVETFWDECRWACVYGRWVGIATGASGQDFMPADYETYTTIKH